MDITSPTTPVRTQGLPGQGLVKLQFPTTRAKTCPAKLLLPIRCTSLDLRNEDQRLPGVMGDGRVRVTSTNLRVVLCLIIISSTVNTRWTRHPHYLTIIATAMQKTKRQYAAIIHVGQHQCPCSWTVAAHETGLQAKHLNLPTLSFPNVSFQGVGNARLQSVRSQHTSGPIANVTCKACG